MYRPFSTLLVANRGEVAGRVLRTARDLGLRTVAVFSDADADAPFVAEADRAVRLPGAAARDTYLDPGRVLAAAEHTGADAVHPGYGFLAERADFAAEVQARGLVWVGPPVAAMEAMATKVEAKARMAAVGIPTLASAVVGPAGDPAAAARPVGFPLLVKASAGGGGRGMRLVEEPGHLADAVADGSREAASSFGDGTVFLERYLPAPRHVEVQVIGDAHGAVVHLGDRECSIQRRHQKLVEEAPAPTVSDALRRRMAEAALAGASALGYVGAGTFEFLVDGDEFFFLEMNTRLQVEHPVTEEVTGLDLVELQLVVAAGHPLPLAQDDVVVRGHAVEARLYAEDPAAGWLPSTGRLHRFSPGTGRGIRWDAGVRTGSVVGPHYDPMLAKAIAWAPTRDLAAARLAGALSRTVVHGVTTNAALLSRVLAHPAFVAAETTTAFLDRHPEVVEDREAAAVTRRHVLVAAALGVLRRRAAAPVAAFAPAGWRVVPGLPQHVAFEAAGGTIDVRYHVRPGGSLDAEVDGHPMSCRVVAVGADAADVEVDGVRWRVAVDLAGDAVHVHDADGATTMRELPRFTVAATDPAAGGLVAPVPGTVVAVHVAAGDAVTAGQVLVVLEAMKVEHQVRSPVDGVVDAVLVAVGESVDAHDPLVHVAG